MRTVVAIFRALQLVFSVVILGLAVDLAKGQVYGSAPATTGYSAFTGGFGIVAALIGFAAFGVGALDGVITWAVDGLAALCFLAAGIALAIQLRGTDCSDAETLLYNTIINGGSVGKKNKDFFCGYCATVGGIQSRFRKATADEAFEWMAFAVSALALGASFLAGRGGSSGAIV